jgi:hypothetical protein
MPARETRMSWRRKAALRFVARAVDEGGGQLGEDWLKTDPDF